MYLDFKEKMTGYPVFSKADILMQFPGLDNRRLTEWQQKGYIEKLRNSYYLFSNRTDSELLRFFISNTIYEPSYVSLQSALSYHHYIPEAAFHVTAVSTNKTKTFETPRGTYLYQTIQPAAFLGYELIKNEEMTVKIASPEKALVDLIYLNKKLRDADEIRALRLENVKMQKEFSFESCGRYASFFQSKVLEQMISLLKEMYA